jgi:hypothetical protein
MNTLTLTKENLKNRGGSQNVYEYEFPAAINTTDLQVALASVNVFYSWFNITAKLGNNTFSYTYPNGASNDVHSVVIEDGFYSVAYLNAYFQYIFVQNKTYLIDDNGNNVYYMSLVVNQAKYALQLLMSSVPTVLPAGWTSPAGGPALPAASTNACTQIILQNGLGDYLGMPNGSIPDNPNHSAFTALSTVAPNVNPVSNIQVLCDLAYNNFSATIGDLLSFTLQNVEFGANAFIQPSTFNWNNMSSGHKKSFTISFVDQLNRPVEMIDPDICVNLVIRIKP